jgi:hypothetical protein
MYFGGEFPIPIYLAAVLIWSGVVRCTAEFEFELDAPNTRMRRAAIGAVGIMLIVLVAKEFGGRLSWIDGAAIGLALGISLSFIRWLVFVAIGRRTLRVSDGLCWAMLQALAALVVYPYVRSAKIGAGDAYHYSLTLADFISQFRAGVFPIFIGQSEFAFNGGIHTIRTAPYFVHLGAALDMVTLHTLPVYAVANLAIVFSVAVGVLGTYAAMLLYAPTRGVTAAALAALFILSPAVLAPLYEGDMIATFMTVPMIPWWVFGLAMAADEPATWRPWLIQGAALAGMWWAHPPMAIWATGLTVGGWGAILAFQRDRRTSLERMTAAALLCALLSAYVFVSVLSLRLPPGPETKAAEATTVLGNITRNWKAALMPLSAEGNLLGDIQLGYSLIAGTLAGLLAIGHRKSASVLFICVAILLVPVFPIPGLTPRMWSLVPRSVFDVTNAWPMQRLYPLLAGITAFAALSAAPLADTLNMRGKAVLGMAFAVGIAWSLSEVSPVIERGRANTADEETSAQLFRPENVSLTRVSYMFFGFYPGYFSHSPMDPMLETRLIDPRTMTVIADGSTMSSGRTPPGTYDVELSLDPNGNLHPEIPIKPSQTAVLRFDFLGRDPSGVLQLIGRELYREYRLPTSGAEKSFGSGPGNSRAIAVRNTTGVVDSVRMNFIPSTSADAAEGAPRPFARVSVEPVVETGHVIELRSLLPLRAIVRADRTAVLETPRINVPGYRARVNGKQVSIVRTAEGLVGVPVGPGASDVIVDYPGSLSLQWSYGVSACAWLSLAFCGFGVPIVDASGDWRRRMLAPGSAIRRAGTWLPTIALGLILLSAIGLWTWKSLVPHRSGAVRLLVRMPVGETHRSEPLVTTGRTFAGDVIYINYLGNDRVSVGHDSWGHAVAVSSPIAVDFLVPQLVEVSMTSLQDRRASSSGTEGSMPSVVSVKWNGSEILVDKRGSYPPGSEDAEIGKNLIGASTCAPKFSGEILEDEPIKPWTP